MTCKFWLEPIELAGNHGFSARELNQIRAIIERELSTQMTLSESLKRAAEAWKQAGVELLPPASRNEIRGVLQEIGRRETADIVQLYEFTGGFAGGIDEHIWSLWSLARIREVNAVDGRPQIAFSDGLIDSFYFSLRYEDDSVSSVWIDHGAEFDLVHVASSLAEFFDIYLSDPERIGLL